MSAAEPAAERPPVDWARLLVWFMRVAAVAWLVKGLFAWGQIFGGGPVAFAAIPPGEQARLVAVAVADPVVAVGLWLVAGWGGALWILVVVVQALFALAGPGGGLGGRLAVLAPDLALVAAFVALTSLAARARPE